MSIADKLTTIAENQQAVYDAGKQDEYDRFWDVYQGNGTQTNCDYMFYATRWSNENFRPKYDIRPTSAQNMFARSNIAGDLTEILADLGIALSFSNATNVGYAFCATKFTKVGTLDLQKATSHSYIFYDASFLKEIEKIIMPPQNSGTYEGWFSLCTALEKLTIDGEIKRNGFNFNRSTKLTHDSLMSIINALADKSADTSATWKITLGESNLPKLTDAEKAIATEKGWTLA